MGQTYDVTMTIRFKNRDSKDKAIKELRKRTLDMIKNKEVFFSCVNPTLLTSNIQDLMKLYLADSDKNHMSVDKAAGGYQIYNNSFNATYSWESLMYDMFCMIAKYLTKNSSILIYPDSGRIILHAKDVKEDL